MAKRTRATLPSWRDDPARVRPMLATLTDAPPDANLTNPRLIYEPKYDGIRALVLVEPGHPAARVRIWSRLGNDKTTQFPDLVRDLKLFGRKLGATVLLDGEIVALGDHGEPVGFQQIQKRLHVQSPREIDQLAAQQPVAFVAFDVLRDGADDVRGLTLTDRKARLERIIGNEATERLRLGPMAAGDGRRLYEQAERADWEGLVAKDADSRYESGRRSPAWRKLKITRRQEFIVGGWSEPRQSRAHFGALLLGVYERPARAPRGRPGRLVYVGHVGSGFTDAELRRVSERLRPLETPDCPFAEMPSGSSRWGRPSGAAHWVKPRLVAEVKYTEWTDEGVLRHPVYLGLRDDVPPETVGREAGKTIGGKPARVAAAPASRPARAPARKRPTRARSKAPGLTLTAQVERVLAQIEALEAAGKDGTLDLGDGQALDVTNLRKVFWPALGITKGELLRYYTRVSPFLLPAVADRAMVMKRLPNGISGKAFYQQRAPDQVPAGVRAEIVSQVGPLGEEETLRRAADPEDEAVKPMIVGGSLLTLLYMTQLAAISQDPWFSQVASPDCPDYVAIDLDPMPGVGFAQILDVARWVGDELRALDVVGVPKTSGAAGLHVYIPLPPDTTYESGQLFCRIIATVVAAKHPKVASVERAVGARGRTVYVDFLQNIRGKTLATAYSARASEFAGVSTPLTWEEVDEGVEPEWFTVRTVFDRFAQLGDLWATLRTAEPPDLHAALDRLSARM